MAGYIPRQGDYLALNFNPQTGHEQRGRRPALVISSTLFNRETGLVIVCPLTNTDRRYPFHVPVGETESVKGFVMVEQVKSFDYRARAARRLGTASDDVLEAVLGILDACLHQ